jgi:hypothetical protein
MSPASARSATVQRFCFFYEAPLFIKLHGAWGDVVHPLVMPPLSVAPRYPEQSRDRIFGQVHQASGRAHPAPFTQMINDGLSFFLCDLRIEQCCAPSLRELLAAGTAPEESDAVVAVDFAHGEIVLASEAKLLAFAVHTR